MVNGRYIWASIYIYIFINTESLHRATSLIGVGFFARSIMVDIFGAKVTAIGGAVTTKH